jgi:MFS family permease
LTAAVLRFNDRAFASVRKYRNYRLFFLGQTISLPGTWMQRITQSWLILTLTKSPLAVGLLALAQFVPFTAFSLFAGVVVDRLDARRTVIGTQICQMVLASSLAAITLSGVVEAWQVYVIAFLGGTVQVLDAPSRQQLTYRMVGRSELQNAVALNSSVFNASRVWGPALAGIFLAAFGAGICFAINAVSFLAVLAGLMMMRQSEFFPVKKKDEVPTMLRGVGEGLSYVRRDRDVALVLLLTVVISTFCLNFNVLLPVLAKQTLHAGPRTFGVLSAAFGLGALVGGLMSAAQGRARKRILLLGSAGFGLSELLLAPGSSVWLACILLFVGGISFTTWSSNSNSIVQLAAPDHLRGRVIGLYFFAFAGTGAVGGILAGWLIHVGGTGLAFAVAGIAALAATGVVGHLLRTERAPMQAEQPTPDSIAA